MKLPDAVPAPSLEWWTNAECRGSQRTEAFYPGSGRQPSDAEWRRFCEACPVWDECLAEALLNREQFGIWGGFNEKERERLARRLARGSVTWVQVLARDPWAERLTG